MVESGWSKVGGREWVVERGRKRDGGRESEEEDGRKRPSTNKHIFQRISVLQYITKIGKNLRTS